MKLSDIKLDLLHFIFLGVAVVSTGLWLSGKSETQAEPEQTPVAEMDSTATDTVYAANQTTEQADYVAPPGSTSEPLKVRHETAQASPDKPAKPAPTYGFLKFENFDGVPVDYIGETKNGQAHGFGYAIFDKKGFYEGEWVHNLCHGTGTYTWQSGDRYKGQFENGYKEGYGVYTFTTGETYKGHWAKSKRHGEGTLTNKKGKVLYSGMWDQDEPVDTKKKKKR